MSEKITFCAANVSHPSIDEITVVVRCEGRWLLVPDPLRLPCMACDVDSPAQCAQKLLHRIFGVEAVTLSHIENYISGARFGVLYLAELADGCVLPNGACSVLLMPFGVSERDKLLFSRVQYRLNLRTSEGELWDVLDGERRPTGRTHPRGIPLPEGEYHTVVLILLQNSKGEFLITRRAPNKGFPNMWEFTGGSALAGDDSRSAAVREVFEETGIVLDPTSGICVATERRHDSFMDIWHFVMDFDVTQVVLQEGETTAARAATRAEIIQMEQEGAFIPFPPCLAEWMRCAD